MTCLELQRIPARTTQTILVLICALWTSTAYGEWSCPEGGSSTESEALASEAFDEGERLFREEDYASARARFRCSFELFPHRATLYNIAQSTERLGDIRGAIEVYWEYLLLTPEDEERTQVEAHVRELEEQLGSVPVDEADGEDRADDDDFTSGVEHAEVDSSLDEEESAAEPDGESGLRSRQRLHPAWLWGLLGLTGATAVIMTATGASTVSLADRWIEEGNVDDRDRALSLRTTTDGFLIVLVLEAIATLTVGLFTDFSSLRRDRNDETQ